MESESDPTESQPKPPLPRAEPPSRIQLEEDGSTTRVSWAWFTGDTGLAWLFCLLFNGFWGYWYSQVLSEEDVPWLTAVGGLLFAGPCLAMAYWLLLRTFNRTYIEVSRNLLTLRHGPLPWRRTRALPGRSLRQLYVEKVVSAFVDSSDNHIVTYNLMALDREGRQVTLVTGVEDKEEALYLEQLLEGRLGIEDAPVDGEVATRARVA